MPFADAEAGRWIQAKLVGGRGAKGPTHVPSANEDGDHVRLWLLRMLVLHLLQ